MSPLPLISRCRVLLRTLVGMAAGVLLGASPAPAQEILALFTRVVDDDATALVVGLHSCTRKTDPGIWLSTLTVTEAVEAKIDSALDAGKTVHVRVSTEAHGNTLMRGTAFYRTSLQVNCGPDAGCASVEESKQAPPDFLSTNTYKLDLRDTILRILAPGDEISLLGFATGVVDPNGCENDDQAAIDAEVSNASLWAE